MSGVPVWDLDDERCARAAWSRVAEPGDAAAGALVAALGPGQALRHVLDGRLPGGGEVPARWRVRLADLDPRADLDVLARCGGRLLVPGDEEWPVALADLGAAAPICLWVRGAASLGVVCERAVSVVGCRASSSYGELVAAEIGAGCATSGVTVVSGAAYGIDGAAHRGSLSAGGPTVAVLACGPDRAYPRGHETLVARVAQDGVVVSEVPPGSAPTRWRFLERNRLIAALGAVTVVVEAAVRSGSLNTARVAGELGRTVAAVPGPVTSVSSTGTNALLRDGAVCVTDAGEVLELLAPLGTRFGTSSGTGAGEGPDPTGRGAGPEGQGGPPVPGDDVAPLDRRLLDALPLTRGAAVASVARVAGLGVNQVLAGLGRLEVAGLAERHGDGWRRHRTRRR